MDAILRDLRWAWRALVRRPAVTVIVLLTLTLGIGANTAIYSIVQAVLLSPLPYAEPERLTTIWQDETKKDGPEREWTSWDSFDDWRREARSFSGMSAVTGWRPTLVGDGEPEMLGGAQASYELLDVLGVEPVMGRKLEPADDIANAEPVVLLGHGLWQRRFGGDREVLDRSILLQGMSHRVVGVLPPDFDMPIIGRADVLGALRTDRQNSCGRNCIYLRVVARLADDTTIDGAREEMLALSRRLEEEHPRSYTGVDFTVLPLHELVVGNVRTPLMILLSAVALVLLVCCANIANLLLVRTQERQSELALRSALGADRGRIIRQLLLESVVLALVGGVLGVLFANRAVALAATRLADQLPRVAEAQIDGRVLLFTLAVSLIAGLLFGLAPATRGTGVRLSSVLGQRASARSGSRLQKSLVVAEVALALLLLISAGLLIRSFLGLVSTDLGFDPERLLVARVSLPQSDYPEPELRASFAERSLERLRTVPGVTSVSHTMSPALAGFDGDSSFAIENRPPPEPGSVPVAWVRSVDPDYFRNLGIRLLRGRGFEPGDRQGATDIVVINQTAEQRWFAGEEPLGKRLSFGGTPPRWREIVGVVADTRHFGLRADARPAAYFPYAQSPVPTLFFLLRAEGNPLDLARSVRAVISEIDPNLALAQVQTMNDLVAGATTTERLLAWLLGAFSALAVLLAAIGLYGVMSYGVSRRRHEIGVRMALGASGRSVLQLMLGQGMALVLIGSVLGILAALAGARLLSSLLHQISPRDPATFVVLPLLLAAVALVAVWAPARRASRTSVLDTLRSE